MSEDSVSSHPDIERLAAAAGEDALPPDLRAHLSSCAACAGDLAALRTTVGALRSLPSTAMPAAVAARLDQTIRDASPTPERTVLPLRPRRTWLPLSAAAAAVLIAAAVTAGLVTRNNDAGNARVTAGAAGVAGTPLPAVLFDTARDYTAANVARLVPTLLTGGARRAQLAPSPEAAKVAQGAPAADSAAGGTALRAAAPPDPLARLRVAAALRACLDAVTEAPGEVPLAVDYARYAARPALIVVLPGPDERHVDVFVLGPTCGPADAAVRYFRRLAR
ncbi:MAG: hypothetical protein ABR520_10910 [Mycobacteriales bacterium]|nr:hypothetical protein [Frankia sp.]